MRVLNRVQRFDGGRLTVSYISREDYDIAGSDESLSEGIVDHIRHQRRLPTPINILMAPLARKGAHKTSVSCLGFDLAARGVGGGAAGHPQNAHHHEPREAIS